MSESRPLDVLRAIVDSSELTTIERMVLVVVLRYADGATLEAWPSVATIARGAGVSRRAAQGALSAVEQRGIVAREHRRDAHGRPTSSRYRLVPSAMVHVVPGTVQEVHDTVHHMHGDGAGGARGMVHVVHGDGAGGAPKLIKGTDQVDLIKVPGGSAARSKPRGGSVLASSASDARQATRRRTRATTATREPSAHDRYATAWATGIAAVTGRPCSPPKRDRRDGLVTIATTHCRGADGAPLGGDALLGAIEQIATDYARAMAEDDYHARRGYAPALALEWLDGGRRECRTRGRSTPPKTQQPAPQDRPTWMTS